MISQIAEAISAFFYSMDVIDEEEKGKSRYGIEIIISTIIGFSVIIISGILLSKTNLAIAYLICIVPIVIVFYNYDFIYGSNIVYGNDEYFKTIVFIGINIILHEMSHYLSMKLYGRKAGKIKIKFYLKIFPCVVTNTTDSYMLPNYRRAFIYYAGIMTNWIICGLVITFYIEEAYLLRAIVWMNIYNMIPFGGIKTDGYHIIVNTLLNVKDLKNRKSIISEIAKCAFILWAVISVYQSLSMIISN